MNISDFSEDFGMRDEISIGEFSSQGFSPLIRLAQEEYGGGDLTNEEYFRWLYFQNPAGKAIITVATDKENICAGQYVVIPVRFSIQGIIKEGSLSLNTLIHPSYRGQGLFRKTAERTFTLCGEKNIYFTVGMPNKNSFAGFTGSLGFMHVGDLKLLVKPLRVFSPMKPFLSSSGKKGSEINLNVPEQLFSDSFSELNLDTDRDDYEIFLQKWERGKGISVHRSPVYLKWRFENHPTRKYHLLKERVNGNITAFAVIRSLHLFGLRAGLIVDFCSLKNSAALISSITRLFKSNKMDVILSLSTGFGTENDSLRSSGYYLIPGFLLPQKLPFIFKSHKDVPDSRLLSELKNWHFTFGDYDVF